MGLNISPSIWQSYINAILDCLQSRKYCEAIMDDLLLFTPSKGSHIAKLEDLLKTLLKNGLKISPKKCQLFRMNLQYMGNTIFIKIKEFACKTIEGQTRSNTKVAPTYYSKRMQKLHGNGEFSKYVLSQNYKIAKTVKTNIRSNKEG